MAPESKTGPRGYSFWGIFAFAAVFILVGAMGILSYLQLNNIITTVNEAGRPDVKLLAVRDVQSKLFEAENKVKTYVLTQDSTDLMAFQAMAGMIDTQLDLLFEVATRDEWETLYKLDSLIYEKFQIQGQLLALRAERNEIVNLDALSSMLLKNAFKIVPSSGAYYKSGNPNYDSSEPTETEGGPDEGSTLEGTTKRSKKIEEVEREEEKREGLFRRLFSGKDKNGGEDQPKIIVDEPPVIKDKHTGGKPVSSVILPSILKRELDQFGEEERERYLSLTEDELQLTQEEQKVAQEIRNIVSQIEKTEQALIQEQTGEARKMASKANTSIIIFCAAMGLVLLLLGIGTIDYSRTNKQYRESTEEARAAAENLARTRESFLATMSHEIRTPMNAVLGFTDRVLRSDLAPGQAEQLKLIKGSARHLLDVVNDVLDFAKLDAGNMNFVSEPFRLADNLALCLSIVKPGAAAKNVEVNLEMDKNLPAVIVGDSKRLRQVLLNLLNNAVRFTENGQVKLVAKSAGQTDGKWNLHFFVKDSGIGIPEEDHEAVFEEFKQVESGNRRKYGGTGLGLPICKQIVEGQGGRIWLFSETGKGTEVHFELAFAEGKGDVSEAIAEVGSVLDGPPQRVLIVDDTEYNRKLLAEILESRGVRFREAQNGREALEILEEEQFDVILLDIRMPELNGLQVMEKIRAGETGAPQDQPVVALTAAVTDQEQAECREAGSSAILIKPFEESRLCQLLQLPVHIQRKNTDDSDNAFSLARLERMANGNPEFVKKMVSTYIQMAHKAVADLSRHVSEGKHQEIAEILHKLAPPTKHIGADSMYQRIKKLESDAKDGVTRTHLSAQFTVVESGFTELLPELEKALNDLGKN